MLFPGQLFHPSGPSGNLDFQFQHNFASNDFAPSSSEATFLSGQTSAAAGFGSAVLALPTPPNEARDDATGSTSSSLSTASVHCKAEPHPSPTELQQQQQQQQQQMTGTTWTPMTPPSSATITGFYNVQCLHSSFSIDYVFVIF